MASTDGIKRNDGSVLDHPGRHPWPDTLRVAASACQTTGSIHLRREFKSTSAMRLCVGMQDTNARSLRSKREDAHESTGIRLQPADLFVKMQMWDAVGTGIGLPAQQQWEPADAQKSDIHIFVPRGIFMMSRKWRHIARLTASPHDRRSAALRDSRSENPLSTLPLFEALECTLSWLPLALLEGTMPCPPLATRAPGLTTTTRSTPRTDCFYSSRTAFLGYFTSCPKTGR